MPNRKGFPQELSAWYLYGTIKPAGLVDTARPALNSMEEGINDMARENTGKWKNLRRSFLDSLTDNTCHLCYKPVDLSLSGSVAQGPQVDHIKSVHEYPHLQYDLSNLALSHKVCNQRKYNKPVVRVINPAYARMPGEEWISATPDGRWYSRYDDTYGWVRVGCGTIQWSGEEALVEFKNGRALVV